MEINVKVIAGAKKNIVIRNEDYWKVSTFNVKHEGAGIALRFDKNRDGRKVAANLEPVWTGHRTNESDPLAVRFEQVEPPTSEAGLPPNAAKMLAAIRAAGPLTRDHVNDAVPGIHKSNKSRNLNLLVQRGLVQQTADGLYIEVQDMVAEGLR